MSLYCFSVILNKNNKFISNDYGYKCKIWVYNSNGEKYNVIINVIYWKNFVELYILLLSRSSYQSFYCFLGQVNVDGLLIETKSKS